MFTVRVRVQKQYCCIQINDVHVYFVLLYTYTCTCNSIHYSPHLTHTHTHTKVNISYKFLVCVPSRNSNKAEKSLPPAPCAIIMEYN
jgi:hypothetical protein